MMLRLVTLNTWQERGPWRERWELIFAGLKFYQPDIIGFQEVFNMEWADEIQKRSGYPHLVKSGQHSGLIFLSKFPVLESECLTMKTKSPTEDYWRYAHYSLFQVNGKKIAGFNTHLSWQQHDDDVRFKQTGELCDLIKRKSGGWPCFWKNVPAFVMGDFNSAANKPCMQNVQALCEDTFAVLNPEKAGLTWDYINPYAERARDHMPERRIDYIFTKGLRGRAKRSEIVFNQSDINDVYPSDHFGVMTEIDL